MIASDRICVQVKILPWFSGILVPGQHSSVMLEEEMPSGSSLRTLLSLLTERFARFEELVYNPKEDMFQGHVVLTHNGRLVSPTEALTLVLQSGDAVALIPAYSGG